MNNTTLWTYRISTTLLCLLMLFSAGMYFAKYDIITVAFAALGYPIYLIYPLAIAKILGVIAIGTGLSKMLKEWAYIGFFFDLVLALTAHLVAADGGYILASAGLVFFSASYFSYHKLNNIYN